MSATKSYRVNEIFYSLQGEGYWTGTPMVFVRLCGCNLACPFCDTDHRDGTLMSAEEIVDEVRSHACGRICLTGGEPSLQAERSLVEAFHLAGYRVHVETNGTRPLPEGIDWITLSPKDAPVVLERADEVKLVYTGDESGIPRWLDFPGAHFLQPCDTGDAELNRSLTGRCIDYIKKNPEWRLSLQTHKLLDIR